MFENFLWGFAADGSAGAAKRRNTCDDGAPLIRRPRGEEPRRYVDGKLHYWHMAYGPLEHAKDTDSCVEPYGTVYVPLITLIRPYTREESTPSSDQG